MIKNFLFIFCYLWLPNSIVHSAPTKVVKILSWWSYFDPAWVRSEIKNTCKVDLAVQSYKDANEFSKSFDLSNYDIAIYELSQFKEVEKQLPSRETRNHLLQKNSYQPFAQTIQDNFIKDQGTAFFFIANTVFLYNPQNVVLDPQDTMQTIIKKLGEKNSYPFIILDDAVIINSLVVQETSHYMTTKHFQKLFNYPNLIVSNDFIDYRNLGAFFTWSGSAIYHYELAKKQGVKLKIITIPRYSFATGDLVSLFSDSKEARCVAQLICSRNFLQELQKNNFYYLPFKKHANILHPTYTLLEKHFVKDLMLKKTKWLLPSKEELEQSILSWEKIILDYGF